MGSNSIRRTGNEDSSSSLSKNAASLDFVLSIYDVWPWMKKAGALVQMFDGDHRLVVLQVVLWVRTRLH